MEDFFPRTKRSSTRPMPPPTREQNLWGRRTGSRGSGCAFHLQVAANKAAERRPSWLVNFYADHKSTVLGGPSECIAKLNRPISGNYLLDKHTAAGFFAVPEHYYNKLVRGGTGRERKKEVYRFCIYHFRGTCGIKRWYRGSGSRCCLSVFAKRMLLVATSKRKRRSTCRAWREWARRVLGNNRSVFFVWL